MFGNDVSKAEQPRLSQSCSFDNPDAPSFPGNERALEVLVIKGIGDTDS